MRLNYLRATGRTAKLCICPDRRSLYYKAQGLWGIPHAGMPDRLLRRSVDLDLATREAERGRPQAPAGPHLLNIKPILNANSLRRPPAASTGTEQDRLSAKPKDGDQPTSWRSNLASKPKSNTASATAKPIKAKSGHGSVVIAAITSCTNTSNPSGDAGRRTARPESRCQGPHRREALPSRPRSARQLAGRHRLPEEDRPPGRP